LTPNFMHVTGEQAKHFAYVISECSKRDIRTVEPTEEAEKDWCDTIVAGTAIRAEFFKECTPGYYNNEGKPSITAARNATYGGGSPAFLKILTDWRTSGDFKGLDIRPFDRKETEKTPETEKTLEVEKAPEMEKALEEERATEGEKAVEEGKASEGEKAPEEEKALGEENAQEERIGAVKVPEERSTEHIEKISTTPTANGEGENATVQNGIERKEPEENSHKVIVDETKANKAANLEFPANLVSPAGNSRSLVQKYLDLHAKHQSEVNDLLSQQRLEVERFLKGQISPATNGVNGVH
jgi:hypothetical protein